jgi:hypothetical protein
MTYSDRLEFFDREIVALGRQTMELTLPQIIAAFDTSGSKEADAVCKYFADKITWPEGMSPSVRLEVCLRLHCARWWCLKMDEKESDSEAEGQNLKEFLEDLLIEYWHDVGRVDWIHDHFVKEWAEREFPGSTGDSD